MNFQFEKDKRKILNFHKGIPFYTKIKTSEFNIDVGVFNVQRINKIISKHRINIGIIELNNNKQIFKGIYYLSGQ